jgi:hypothetical protein
VSPMVCLAYKSDWFTQTHMPDLLNCCQCTWPGVG